MAHAPSAHIVLILSVQPPQGTRYLKTGKMVSRQLKQMTKDPRMLLEIIKSYM